MWLQTFSPGDTNSYPRFRQKFKSFVEQYELREIHFYSLLRTKEGEIQLSQARAEEHRKRAETETAKSRTLSAQVNTFSQTESELRSQLNIYVEKFKQASSRFAFCQSMSLLPHRIYRQSVGSACSVSFSLISLVDGVFYVVSRSYPLSNTQMHHRSKTPSTTQTTSS